MTEPPLQNVVAPEEVTVGVVTTRVPTEVLAVYVHPLGLVVVTEYEPAVLTLIDGVVSPVDHR